MKSLVEFILEKQGIFNGCEDIANELVSLFVKKIKTMKHHIFSFEFDASKYNPIFKDDIVIEIQIDDRQEIDAESNFVEDKKEASKKIRDMIVTGYLLIDDEEIKKVKKRKLKITVKIPLEYVNLYDLKGTFMHELTHVYAAIIFYDKGENYFNRRYFSPEDQENASEYLLYLVQKDEVNCLVTEFKAELDKIKRKGFDNVFDELKNHKDFNKVIKYRNDFNKQNWFIDFKKIELPNYPDLYRNHFECDYSDTKIYRITRDIINDAYNQLYTAAIKMIYEYKGSKDYILDNFKEDFVEPYMWFTQIRSQKRK